MAATLTTLDAILKTQYLGPIQEQINNATPLLKRINKNYDSVVGKNFTIPLHYGRNQGIGARADGGKLPTAGNQAYKECIVPMRYEYGRIQITGPTIKAASANEGAFVRAVESEMKGLKNDMTASLNRQAFGDGTGKIATCVSADGTAVTVDSTAKLQVGMPIDILLAATGAEDDGKLATSVASITSSTVFVVGDALTSAAGIDATHAVYIAGSRALEMQGLAGIASATATLQGLDVATYPWWVASVQGNSGTNRSITDVLLQTALDTLAQTSNGKASALYTSYGVRRAYAAYLNASKQMVNTMKLEGGFEAISFNGLPIIPDKDCEANTIFVCDEDQLSFYRLSDFDWMDDDGSILSKVSGYDAYEAVLYIYQELGTGMRNAFVRIDDITEA